MGDIERKHCSGGLGASVGLLYGSHDSEERKLMYDELTRIIATLSHPLMLLEDFN